MVNKYKDMDTSVSIERKIAAMKAFHDAKVRTTCFISPIFPEITDCKAIIKRTKDICNLVWLENLNLRGNYQYVILKYIADRYPALTALYNDIYNKKDRTYWYVLDEEMRAFCAEEKLEYIRDDDSMKRPFDAPPIVVNYFFHEEVKKSAKKNTPINKENPPILGD